MSYSHCQQPSTFEIWPAMEQREEESVPQRQHSEIPSPTKSPSQYLTMSQVPQLGDNNDGPILLHPPYPERRRTSLRMSESRLREDDARVQAASGPGPIRNTRHSSQPLLKRSHRTLTAAKQTDLTVRFADSIPTPPLLIPSPATASPIVPSPPINRMTPVTAGSPLTNSNIPQIRRSAMAIPRQPYILRVDSHYDPDTKMMTVAFEMPGVKKGDVSVTLTTCNYNRVRQLIVTGRSYPAFPSVELYDAGIDSSSTIRERKYGEFTRTIAVPAETKVRTHSFLFILFLVSLFRNPSFRCFP